MSDECSEKQLKVVLATVDEWYQCFAQSPAFARLSDSHQRKAGAITDFFAQYTYDYLGLPPREWDCEAVAECCAEILPRKVSAEPAFFEAIAPVLSAFFKFLAEQALVPNGRAFAHTVESLRDNILANSQDSSSWGPAKRFVMAAYDAGVDIENSAALQAFMAQFNQVQAARSGWAGAQPSPWPDASPPLPNKPTVRPPAHRYDPCPCGTGKKYKFCCEPKSR